MKTCSKCAKDLDSNEFYKDSRKRDGLRSNCKSCQKGVVSEYRALNKDVIQKRHLAYYQKNREKILLHHRGRKSNSLSYYHRVRKHNLKHRINSAISAGVWQSLKGQKGGKSWEAVVGYSLSDLINHIEPLMIKGMTWDNYGPVWHIDHIKPKSKCESIEEAWSILNLQPLFKQDNLRKGNKFECPVGVSGMAQ
jgi:hypothetical protein